MNTRKLRRTMTLAFAIILIISALAVPALAVSTAKKDNTKVWTSPDNVNIEGQCTAILNKGDQINGTKIAWPTGWSAGEFPNDWFTGDKISYCARDNRVVNFVAWSHNLNFNC